MSINPPLDIVLDVVKAADPARYKEAVAKLTRLSSDATPTDFANLIDTAPPSANPFPAPSAKPMGDAKVKDAAAYRDFEAMTLATFIEAALPENASEVFGEGTAGGVWKSMLADQIAKEMAKSGGIGIARQLAAFERQLSAKPVSSVGPVASAAGPFDPSLLTMTAERGFIDRVSKGEAPDKTSPAG